MVDHQPQGTPFSRFSRFHFGFKPPSPPPPPKEDDWYIPYNGPYEPPRLSKPEKERDSWGQVIGGDDDDELVDRDLRYRYGALQEDRKYGSNFDRERAQSTVSGRTKSSGAVDPNRISTSSPRQSNVSYPAYINLNIANGVGASPMPLQRSAPPEMGHRPPSFAQFFSLGARKSSAPTPVAGPSSNSRGKSPIRPHSPLRNPSPTRLTPSPHPYAYALAPDPGPSHPSTAPLVSGFPTQNPRPLGQLRKASISTPNLREPTSVARPPKPRLPKGKDKWLSPETWCDALFLPRPKFKMKDDRVRMNRIVSPPGSPISPNSPNSAVGTGFQSRVLAHSRSLAELREGRPPPGFENRNGTLVFKQLPEPPPPPTAQPASTLKPPRPKSWALDDLALPSPIPSLTKVLEDGDQLERDRKQWQAQATKSFSNNLSRNISRARSKSLGGKGNNRPKTSETPLEFLTARTVLGHQAQMPTVIVSEPQSKEEGSTGRTSHSHKNSLSKTISTMSGKSKAHSRADSWSKSALKMAKSSAALCGLNGEGSATGPPSVNNASIDDFIDIGDTRHIHLTDPAAAEHSSLHSRTGLAQRPATSPTPSGLTDSKVGIALGTPPPASDLSHGTYDVESIRMPAHPYAQGGAYSYRSPGSQSRELPSPVQESSTHQKPSHRIAPRYGSLGSTREVAEAIHPYAQASSSSPYDDEPVVRRLRSDSNISPASKMWAAVAPGVLQEVLPRDFQYSPMISEDQLNQEEDAARRKRDRVSVGEALTLAMFSGSRDSGIGNSEDYPHTSEPSRAAPAPRHRTTASGGGSSKSRIPVQYDASRPVYQQTTAPLTAEPETYDRLTPPKTERNDSSGSSAAPPSHTSSPPLSPRPLGPMDDLENFRDLFFKPKDRLRGRGSEHSESSTPTWTEGSLRSRRTGSGLTMLARQLSQDFEDMRSEEQQHQQQLLADSRSEESSKEGLRFVLAEGRRSALSSIEDTQPLRLPHHKIQAFQPSGTIPEDVEASSSRASSYMEQISDENETALFRLGMVGAESLTPQAHISARRESQHISYFEEDPAEAEDTVHPRLHPTFLKPPQNSQIRESYMTTSTGQSRMSGLSDFPTPPEHTLTPAHASILESFFENTPTTDDTEDFKPPEPRRMTFGFSDSPASP